MNRITGFTGVRAAAEQIDSWIAPTLADSTGGIARHNGMSVGPPWGVFLVCPSTMRMVGATRIWVTAHPSKMTDTPARIASFGPGRTITSVMTVQRATAWACILAVCGT